MVEQGLDLNSLHNVPQSFISVPKKRPRWPFFLFLLILLAAAGFEIYWYYAPSNQSAGVSQSPPAPAATPSAYVPPTTVSPTDDTAGWSLYENSAAGFSLKYPPGVTLGGGEPNPFPVAITFSHDDPVVQIGLGQDKPGWSLTFSQLLPNDSNLSPADFADRNNLLAAGSTAATLGNQSAIYWKSPTYPESYYLVSRGNKLQFIKEKIVSRYQDIHQGTINLILGTLKFGSLADANLGLTWTRQKFRQFWNLEIPENWKVDTTNLNLGSVSAEGPYAGLNFKAVFSYPLNSDQLPPSLDYWVAGDIGGLGSSQRSNITTAPLTVSGTAAKEVFNFPLSQGVFDRLYIWSRNGLNPSLAELQQVSGESDPSTLRTLFVRLVAGIR
ncbi:MAG: hypothetical protein M1352_01720 [Patescibacteria group bacterium]|nr:hypothetical protein [Patescibacteria group bacterium]